MRVEDMIHFIPSNWDPMNLNDEKYRLTKLTPIHQEYHDVKSLVSGNYYVDIEEIYRLQNPYLYTKFKLKEYDFLEKGPIQVETLFHDTDRSNVESISCYNFDWRYGKRFMFGPGVYFSCSPYYANKHSKHIGPYRTMFIATVLIQNLQKEHSDFFLPDPGYDTALCHGGTTYVKYCDNEFYPQYLVNYISRN